MDKTAYLVYEGNQWLERSSLRIIAVCTSFEKAQEIVIKSLRDCEGIRYSEEYDEDEYDEHETYLEDYEKELESNGQILGAGFGYLIEEVPTDKYF